MNNVQIMGRITRDLEIRIVRNDLQILNFSIAYNERRRDKEEVYYFDITAFGKQAENIGKYFKKGQRILVSGRLKQERFNDKEGNPRSKVVLILNDFDFIEPKSGEGENYSQSQSPANNPAHANNGGGISGYKDAPTDLDDEVPF